MVWLNENAAGVTASATVILMLVTAFYAFTTWKLAKLSRDQMEAGSRPYLSVAPFVYKNQMFFLRIANNGRSAALNVRLTVDPDVPRQSAKSLGEAALFREGTASLAPGADYSFFLGHGYWIYGDESRFPMEFHVVLAYEYAGLARTERFVVDFGSMKDSHPFASEGAAAYEGIVEALKGIERKLPNPPSELTKLMNGQRRE